MRPQGCHGARFLGGIDGYHDTTAYFFLHAKVYQHFL